MTKSKVWRALWRVLGIVSNVLWGLFLVWVVYWDVFLVFHWPGLAVMLKSILHIVVVAGVVLIISGFLLTAVLAVVFLNKQK